MNANDIAWLYASMTLNEREGPMRTLKANLKDARLRRMATSKDEEFLFGFWMQAPAPARRTSNGGRRWFPEEKGKASRLPSRDRESWRPLNRTLESDGDRRGNPKVGVADSFRQNPSLVSNSKRKEIVLTDVNGRNAETVGWPIISVSSNLQESEDTWNLILNRVWERKEDYLGLNPVGLSNIGELGHRTITSPFDRASPVERMGRGEIPKHGLVG
ncbi:hypothetical protein Q3G72_006288 [Acer saccharum]|nr:hypothetical protein Q3G72_006288 [Acer saccharum]